MKRALLIAGGTVGGLGAVLSITPPQISSGGNSGLSGLQSGAMTISGTGSSTSATHVAPVSATSASSPASTPSNTTAASVTTTTKKHKVTARKAQSTGTSAQVQTQTPSTAPTQSQTPAAAPTQSQTPAAAAVKSTPKGNSGKFVGTSVFVQYGYVQVELTVENGKITDARALQAPNGRSDRFSQYAIPVLRQQTLNAQSSKIQGASGASYTSWGWYTSLQAALVKAGM